MPCVLYLVSTPIGNLSDISQRALDTLSGVSFIAAEDTRVTSKLLAFFNIKKPIVSCYEHNETMRSNQIIERLLSGENCAFVSDAGTPCISDPGFKLVTQALNSGIKVTSVPGATAFTTALCLSGLNTSRFSFEGFLSVNSKQRRAHLELVKQYPNTMIFYEAPHKLLKTLIDMKNVLGERKIALCRELTKLYEEVFRGTFSQILLTFEKEQKKPRGEYVIVVEGYESFFKTSKDIDSKDSLDSFEDMLNVAVIKALELSKNQDISLSSAAKIIAAQSKSQQNSGTLTRAFSKSEIYCAAVHFKNEQNTNES